MTDYAQWERYDAESESDKLDSSPAVEAFSHQKRSQSRSWIKTSNELLVEVQNAISALRSQVNIISFENFRCYCFIIEITGRTTACKDGQKTQAKNRRHSAKCNNIHDSLTACN